MSIDRVAVSRALAKAIAYKQVGNQQQAEEWARELVRLLECADILSYQPTAAEGNEISPLAPFLGLSAEDYSNMTDRAANRGRNGK